MVAFRTSVEAADPDAVKGARTDGAAGRAPEGMAGLAKGLAVIEAFAATSSPLTVADAARAAGLSRAAARRCLLTLTALGYLSHDGRQFRPTPRMLRLGTAYLETASLPALAQPLLASAREATGESVSLAVLEEDWSVFVARAEAERIVSTGVRLGARLPAHASATGRVLLAGRPDEQVDEYLARCRPEARTLRTIVDRAELRARIDAARAEGVAVTDEELELGMVSMAVPVTDTQGRTVAALSVSASAARVTAADARRDFLPVLRDHAARLRTML